MADQWFIISNGRRVGPYTAAEMKEHAATGHLLPIDLVIKDGMDKPVPAAKVKGLFAPPPAGATTAPTGSQRGGSRPDAVTKSPPATASRSIAVTSARHSDSSSTPERPPAPASRANRRGHRRLLFAGAGVVALVLVAVVVAVMAGGGRKPPAAEAGVPGPAAVAGGGTTRDGTTRDDKGEVPDFSKVDYSLDTSKLDYEKGPGGQPLVSKKDIAPGTSGLLREIRGYEAGDGGLVQHGVTTVRYGPPTNAKAEECHYIAGKQHGPIIAWYENGQKRWEGAMKAGKKHGKWMEWQADGKPLAENWFLNGVQHGTAVEYHPNGVKAYESSFVDGVEHGRRTEYWDTGTEANIWHIRQGVRHGPAVWRDRTGNVVMRLHFRDGFTQYDPTAGTGEDFATAVTCIFPQGVRPKNLKLDQAFVTFGRPVSGFAEIPDRTVGQRQEWVFQCKDGPFVLVCSLTRVGDTSVDFGRVRKK